MTLGHSGPSEAGVKRHVHRLLIVACALYLSGVHWAVLQVTAWTGMLVVRSQSTGLAEAVNTTFDGNHPCRMCSAITDGKKKEQQRQSEYPALKAMQELQLVMNPVAALPAPVPTGEQHWTKFSATAKPRADTPPTPPPIT